MLGHKSATMTLDLYGHLFADRLDTVADALDAARTVELASREPLTTEGLEPEPLRETARPRSAKRR